MSVPIMGDSVHTEHTEFDDVSRYLHNTFLAVGASCFLAMASGIVLQLHLAHVDNPLTHDANHCPTCQQLVASKKDYIAPIEPATIVVDQVGRLIQFYPDAPPLQRWVKPLHARAPPA